jgi:hypothetical protein
MTKEQWEHIEKTVEQDGKELWEKYIVGKPTDQAVLVLLMMIWKQLRTMRLEKSL